MQAVIGYLRVSTKEQGRSDLGLPTRRASATGSIRAPRRSRRSRAPGIALEGCATGWDLGVRLFDDAPSPSTVQERNLGSVHTVVQCAL